MTERQEKNRCGFSIESILHKKKRHGKTSDGESSSSPTPPSSPLMQVVTTFPYGPSPSTRIMVAPAYLPPTTTYPIILPYYPRPVYCTNQCTASPARVRPVTVARPSFSDASDSDGDDSLAEEKTSDTHGPEEEQSCELSPGEKRIDGSFRKKKRTAFTTRQLQELEAKFAEQKYLTKSDRTRLAKRLGLTEKHVKTWYQNRRTKWKRGTTEAEWSRERENSAAAMYHQFVTEKNRHSLNSTHSDCVMIPLNTMQ